MNQNVFFFITNFFSYSLFRNAMKNTEAFTSFPRNKKKKNFPEVKNESS